MSPQSRKSSPPPSAPDPHKMLSEEEDELTYSTSMRIFGGVAWGTLLSLFIGSALVIIPQFPRPWLWVVPGLWIVLSGVGVLVQWNVARGACPKCGKVQTVSALGKRCPDCRSYLKSVNRQVVRY